MTKRRLQEIINNLPVIGVTPIAEMRIDTLEALKEVLTENAALQDKITELNGRVHSCHADCPNAACVNRALRELLREARELLAQGAQWQLFDEQCERIAATLSGKSLERKK